MHIYTEAEREATSSFSSFSLFFCVWLVSSSTTRNLPHIQVQPHFLHPREIGQTYCMCLVLIKENKNKQPLPALSIPGATKTLSLFVKPWYEIMR